MKRQRVLETCLAGRHQSHQNQSQSLSFSYKCELWPELQLLVTNTSGQRIPRLWPARPARLFGIHGGREQTKHFPQWQNKML